MYRTQEWCIIVMHSSWRNSTFSITALDWNNINKLWSSKCWWSQVSQLLAPNFSNRWGFFLQSFRTQIARDSNKSWDTYRSSSVYQSPGLGRKHMKWLLQICFARELTAIFRGWIRVCKTRSDTVCNDSSCWTTKFKLSFAFDVRLISRNLLWLPLCFFICNVQGMD